MRREAERRRNLEMIQTTTLMTETTNFVMIFGRWLGMHGIDR